MTRFKAFHSPTHIRVKTEKEKKSQKYGEKCFWKPVIKTISQTIVERTNRVIFIVQTNNRRAEIETIAHMNWTKQTGQTTIHECVQRKKKQKKETYRQGVAFTTNSREGTKQ